jgi:hypothetical protein
MMRLAVGRLGTALCEGVGPGGRASKLNLCVLQTAATAASFYRFALLLLHFATFPGLQPEAPMCPPMI